MKKDTIIAKGSFSFKIKETTRIENELLTGLALRMKRLISAHFDMDEHLEYSYMKNAVNKSVEGITMPSMTVIELDDYKDIKFYFHGPGEIIEILLLQIQDYANNFLAKTGADLKKFSITFNHDITDFKSGKINIIERISRIDFKETNSSENPYVTKVKHIYTSYPSIHSSQLSRSTDLFNFDSWSVTGVDNLLDWLEGRLYQPNYFDRSCHFNGSGTKKIAVALIDSMRTIGSSTKSEFDIDDFTHYIANESDSQIYLGEKEIMNYFNEIAPKIAIELMTKGNLNTV